MRLFEKLFPQAGKPRWYQFHRRDLCPATEWMHFHVYAEKQDPGRHDDCGSVGYCFHHKVTCVNCDESEIIGEFIPEVR